MGTVHLIETSGPGRRPPLFRSSGRFADWFEPIDVVLDSRSTLSWVAQQRDLDPSVACALLVERELCRLTLKGSSAQWRAPCDAAVSDDLTDTAVGPGSNDASYIRELARALKARPRRGPRATQTSLSVPARLLQRLHSEIDLEAVLDGDAETLAAELCEAIRWEIAASRRGQTMLEWFLANSLAQARAT